MLKPILMTAAAALFVTGFAATADAKTRHHRILPQFSGQTVGFVGGNQSFGPSQSDCAYYKQLHDQGASGSTGHGQIDWYAIRLQECRQGQ